MTDSESTTEHALRFLLRLYNLLQWSKDQAGRINVSELEKNVAEVNELSAPVKTLQASKRQKRKSKAESAEKGSNKRLKKGPEETDFPWVSEQVMHFLDVNNVTVGSLMESNVRVFLPSLSLVL